MALKLTGNSSEYYARSVGLTAANFGGQSGSGTGWTWCAWVKVTGSLSGLGGALSCIVGLGSTVTQAYWGLATDQYSGVYNQALDDTSVDAQYSYNGNFVTGSWVLVMGTFLNSGDQGCYNSNSSPPSLSTNANTVTSTFDHVMVGYQSSSTVFGGNTATNLIEVAEFAIWKNVLGQSEFNSLLVGENPLNVSNNTIFSYFPLKSDLQDYGPTGVGLVPVGGAPAAFTDHPPVSDFITYYQRAINLTDTGTISSTTKKANSSLTSYVNEVGTLASTTKKATSSLSGLLTESGTLSSTTKKANSSLTAYVNEVGTLSSTTKKANSSLTAYVNEVGTLSSTTKKPNTSLTGIVSNAIVIAATTKKPNANLSGNILLNYGYLSSTTKKVITYLTGPEVIASTTKKPVAVLFAVTQNFGPINSTTKKALSNLNATSVVAPNPAVIKSMTKKATTNLTGHITTLAVISSTTKKPNSSITSYFNLNGTITGPTKKPNSSVNMNSSYQVTGMIGSATKKPNSDLSSLYNVSGPFFNWIY